MNVKCMGRFWSEPNLENKLHNITFCLLFNICPDFLTSDYAMLYVSTQYGKGVIQQNRLYLPFKTINGFLVQESFVQVNK
jgi:hypothetical protein